MEEKGHNGEQSLLKNPSSTNNTKEAARVRSLWGSPARWTQPFLMSPSLGEGVVWGQVGEGGGGEEGAGCL